MGTYLGGILLIIVLFGIIMSVLLLSFVLCEDLILLLLKVISNLFIYSALKPCPIDALSRQFFKPNFPVHREILLSATATIPVERR